VGTDDDTTARMVTDLAAADLYALGATLDELTNTLAHITTECAAQTERYPHGRILRDDTDTHDPTARCAEAAGIPARGGAGTCAQ